MHGPQTTAVIVFVQHLPTPTHGCQSELTLCCPHKLAERTVAI
jgi:hypothetical protein